MHANIARIHVVKVIETEDTPFSRERSGTGDSNDLRHLSQVHVRDGQLDQSVSSLCG